MSSKKKHRKKHFKPKASQASPSASAIATAKQSTTPDPVTEALKTPSTAAVQIETPQLKLVRHDIRRVAVLATGFVVMQVILWYLFNNTGLGNAAYRLIQL